MGTIKVIDLADLAEICAELTKNGVTYTADKKGDGYWYVKVEGY